MIAELAARPVILAIDLDEPLIGASLAVGVDVVMVGPEVVGGIRDGLVFELEEGVPDGPMPFWRDEIEDEGFELVSEDEGVVVYRRER